MKIEIQNLGMNGEGVGYLDNKTCFVPFCLPSELVDISIEEEKPNFCFAKYNNIIKPSTDRVAPPCPYFEKCGGCQLQHMNYETQLKFKQELVANTLRKILGQTFSVNLAVPCSTQYGYRNKASFNFLDGVGGFYKTNSNNVVEISSCPLACDEINKIYNLFNQHLALSPIKNLVRHLVVRSIENQHLVGVVVNKDCDLTNFFNLLKENFQNVGLYKIINTRKDSVVLSGKTIHVGGIKEININNFGINYSVDLIGFHQTNIDIQNKIYNLVLENISNNDIVINGFSGAGLLSAIIAQKAKHVYGIEIEKSSHLSAENLKKVNNISNLTNICGDFYKEYKNLNKNCNTIVLDPSKKGCGKQVMQTINGIENIIYISCNPIALAKDLREILNDYNVLSIAPFDMFPNTSNVETVVVLKCKD